MAALILPSKNCNRQSRSRRQGGPCQQRHLSANVFSDRENVTNWCAIAKPWNPQLSVTHIMDWVVLQIQREWRRVRRVELRPQSQQSQMRGPLLHRCWDWTNWSSSLSSLFFKIGTCFFQYFWMCWGKIQWAYSTGPARQAILRSYCTYIYIWIYTPCRSLFVLVSSARFQCHFPTFWIPNKHRKFL